ncbi:hypothetical protein DMUE_5091 [Dictyocoela muelleri]|nr:hypothetical protein DMUE_5091 [Dictyocoela muelleri]
MNIIFYILKIMTSLPEIRKEGGDDSIGTEISDEENLNKVIKNDIINNLKEIKVMIMNINEINDKIQQKFDEMHVLVSSIKGLKGLKEVDKNHDKETEPDIDSSIKNKSNVLISNEDEISQLRIEPELSTFELIGENRNSSFQFGSNNSNQIDDGIYGSFEYGEIRNLTEENQEMKYILPELD